MFSYERMVEDDIENTFGSLSVKLKGEGYIVLSYVDVKEILTKNFGGEHPGYYIMNVCKPQAARDLIGENEDTGLLLPCKIVLIEKGGKTRVLMLRVSQLAKDYLGSDGSKATGYEDELISVLEKL